MVEDKLQTHWRRDRIPGQVIEQTSHSVIGDEFARLIQRRDVYAGCHEPRSAARSTYNDGSSDRDDRAPISPNRRASIFLPTAADDRDNADVQAAVIGHGANHNLDVVPRRRGGLVIAMTVLALTVLGTAGAFGYRVMFGAYVFSALPPIVKANTRPDNTVRNHSDTRRSNTSQSSITSVGSNEKLASREQQPAATAPSLDPPVASALHTDIPPSVPTPASVQAPVPASSEPKNIHAVMVGSDERSATDTISSPALAPHSPTRAAVRSSAEAAPTSRRHDAHRDTSRSTPSRFHIRAGRRTAVEAYSAGSYEVQVASQHSAGAAHASFRALRATFPNELGGRKPVVRRTNLGARGIYYRAMVGPFESMEKAAGMCARLKTAGGDCLVQEIERSEIFPTAIACRRSSRPRARERSAKGRLTA